MRHLFSKESHHLFSSLSTITSISCSDHYLTGYTESEMLPPTIPTSFVPHSSGAAARRFGTNFNNAFGFFSYAILFIMFVFALGIFFYSRILATNQASKEAALARAQASIDLATVESFVHLRNRLSSGATLLGNHVALSSFFALVETLIPTTVRFTSLHLAADDMKAVKLEGTGIAKSFNALAAASAAFATDGRIKEAIFSSIVVTKDNTVSFALSATIDPKLVAFSP